MADVRDPLCSFAIEQLPTGGCLITVTGELDRLSAPTLDAVLDGHVVVCAHVYIDLGGVTFMDVPALEAVEAALRREPQRTTVTATSACVERLVGLTGRCGSTRPHPSHLGRLDAPVEHRGDRPWSRIAVT